MILFTGASGFLGANIYPILSKKYKIETLGLSKDDTYTINLSNEIPKFNQQYQIVIHAAGKVHDTTSSKENEIEHFQSNLLGTKNLCSGLELGALPDSLIFISSVAVYGIETGTNINEYTKLLGSSPYALSKIRAELYLIDWCNRNNVRLGILRPSLIAGKNPPGNLGSMIHAIKNGRYFRIGNGSAQKSVLMAEDLALIMPRLAEVGGIFNVCDNHHPSFVELEELIARQLNKKKPKSIPYWLAKIFALFGDLIGSKSPINSRKLDKITQSLTFSNEKAKRELEWEPLDVLQNFKIS